MKIFHQLLLLIFLIAIQNKHLLAHKREIKYQPSKEHLIKISIAQEIQYCIEICLDCFNNQETIVNINIRF
jgi:hypothetical protein